MTEFIKHNLEGPLDLAADDLHLWLSRTDLDPEPFLPLLSPDEVERANRYILGNDRSTFIVFRALLRSILAAYTAVPAEEVEFVQNEFGKPALKRGEGSEPFYFNASDSKDMMLVGVSAASEVGVDIEYIERERTFLDIAERFFHASEFEKIKALSPENRREAFYRCWTLKEAVVKATGRGLSTALDSFEVGFLSGEPQSLLSYTDEVEISPGFTIKGVYYGEGYAASIAVNGALGNLTRYRLGYLPE